MREVIRKIGCSCNTCGKSLRSTKHFIAADGRILCYKCRIKEKATPMNSKHIVSPLGLKNKQLNGNEHCVKDCEKQGPCQSCGSFKVDNNDKCRVMGTDYCKNECPLCRIGPVNEETQRINVDELNRKFKRPKYHPSSVPR